MTDFKLILSQVNQTLSSLSDWNNLEDFVGQFHEIWLKLGNFVQQQLVQARIDLLEAGYQFPRTKREKRYYTPLGEMIVKRRAYVTPNGLKIQADEKLGLPKDKWLPIVLELACALGVSSEFPNSYKLFQRWTSLSKRGIIRQREYIATLKSRKEFTNRISQLYNQVVGQKSSKTVVIGDGAPWIWSMAQEQFPGSIEILDFFHLSEYVWAVAKAAYPNQEQQQKDWVKTQQQFLKKSQWLTVLKTCHQFRRRKKDLIESITNLERYLNNNQSRIDYQS